MIKKLVMFNILLVLSLVTLSTQTFAQGPFAESAPTEFNAQINPVDPNWQFNPQDSAILRDAQVNRGDGFNWWWLAVSGALLPIFYLASRYFVNNLERDRLVAPRYSYATYHDIREKKRKSSRSKKKTNLKERKYDKSFAP